MTTPKSRQREAQEALTEARRLKVARLVCQKKTQVEIARICEVNQSTICRDLEEVKKRWEAKSEEAYETKIARELADLEEMERQAVRNFMRKRQGFVGERRIEWLLARLQIKDRILKLIMRDHPTKVALTNLKGDKSYAPGHNFTDEEELREAEKVIAFERARIEHRKQLALAGSEQAPIPVQAKVVDTPAGPPDSGVPIGG